MILPSIHTQKHAERERESGAWVVLEWNGKDAGRCPSAKAGKCDATSKKPTPCRSSPSMPLNAPADSPPLPSKPRTDRSYHRSESQRRLPGLQAAEGGVRVRPLRLPRLLPGLRDEGRHRRTVRSRREGRRAWGWLRWRGGIGWGHVSYGSAKAGGLQRRQEAFDRKCDAALSLFRAPEVASGRATYFPRE